jgi:hypothetical protein
MRWHLPVGLILLLGTPNAELSECLSCTAAAQQVAAERPVQPQGSHDRAPMEEPSQVPEARAKPLLLEQLAADPFQYRIPEGTGAEGGVFTPSPALELPPGIKVAGILVMESGDAVAALQLPGEEDLYYVRESDNLQIRSSANDARSARGRDAVEGVKPALYLKISKITPEHVVVYPEHSPTNIHIFR